MNDLDRTTFARFAERFAGIERHVPEPPLHKVGTAIGSRGFGRLSPLAGLVGVVILLVMAVGLAVFGSQVSPRPSPSPAAGTIPPDSAPPEVVLDAYLRALQTGDCDTASQLTMPLVLDKSFVDLCGVTGVTSFSVSVRPVVVDPYTVRLPATLTITGTASGISAGEITGMYFLQQQPSGAWRIINDFLNVAPSMLPTFPPSGVSCDPRPGVLGLTDQGSPIPAHLTCQAAIAAARAAVIGRLTDIPIVGTEFHFRRWCPPGVFCALTTDDEGYVVVHMYLGQPDFLVQVSADATGSVTVGFAGPFPSTAP